MAKGRQKLGDPGFGDQNLGEPGRILEVEGPESMLQTAKTSAGPVMRVGVVGVGVMGSNHARVLAEFPGVVLAGVADPDRKQAHFVGSTVGCPAVASVEELLE